MDICWSPCLSDCLPALCLLWRKLCDISVLLCRLDITDTTHCHTVTLSHHHSKVTDKMIDTAILSDQDWVTTPSHVQESKLLRSPSSGGEESQIPGRARLPRLREGERGGDGGDDAEESQPGDWCEQDQHGGDDSPAPGGVTRHVIITYL